MRLYHFKAFANLSIGFVNLRHGFWMLKYKPTKSYLFWVVQIYSKAINFDGFVHIIYVFFFDFCFLILVERFRSIVEYRQDFREKKKCTNKHWNKYDFSWWSKDRMTGYLKIDPNVMYMRKKNGYFSFILWLREFISKFYHFANIEESIILALDIRYTIHNTPMRWKSINVKLNYREKPFCCYYFECNLMHKYVMQQ